MKTIIFAQPDSPIVQQFKEGEFILAKDPIKTLRAMKKIQNKEDYVVMGDEQSTKYLEFSAKLKYNVYKKPEKPKADFLKDVSLSKLADEYVAFKSENQNFQEERVKWEQEKAIWEKDKAVLTLNHQEEVARVLKESEEKKSQEIKDIKKLIQKAIYE